MDTYYPRAGLTLEKPVSNSQSCLIVKFCVLGVGLSLLWRSLFPDPLVPGVAYAIIVAPNLLSKALEG
uniref:Uncharacterized protein n=1 Tax=Guadeloupe mosquito mononega-like virus TaxID=2607732 RepID=A0A5C1K3U3_9MONO|nr:hypothetical protein [Guadeloupe mosquito mononega-like virus]